LQLNVDLRTGYSNTKSRSLLALGIIVTTYSSNQQNSVYYRLSNYGKS
jgi:hypothetical protein